MTNRRNPFHQDAIPYTETLARLNAEFPLKPGDLYMHDQLRAVIQPESENRYRGVLNAWKRQVAREGKRTLSGEGRARGIGIMVCTAREASDLRIGHGQQGARKLRHAARALDDIETQTFNPDELKRHNLARQLMHTAAAETNKFRNIPPPQAVRSDNVRLLRSGE